MILKCFFLYILVNIAYFSFGTSASASPFFRKDYVFKQETESFYKIHSSRRNWLDALKICRQELADLFVPESEIDRDIVKDLIVAKFPKHPDPGYPWIHIGIHDMFAEGEYLTVEGKPIDEVFVEWNDFEPNNYNNEDCVGIGLNGKMNDVDCNHEIPFVCKKSKASVQWNQPCDLPDPTYSLSKDLQKCYKLHLTPKDWTSAYEVCRSEQSYLAIINSKAEANYFVQLIAEAPVASIKAQSGYYRDAAYLGFHNKLLRGWTTVKGQELESTGYTEWAPTQPDNAGGSELCGSMFFDGLINDITCALSCIFICEHDVSTLSSSVDERFKTLTVQKNDTVTPITSP